MESLYGRYEYTVLNSEYICGRKVYILVLPIKLKFMEFRFVLNLDFGHNEWVDQQRENILLGIYVVLVHGKHTDKVIGKLFCVGLGYRFLLLNFHIIFIWSTSPADISTHVPSSPELWYGRYKRLLNPCLSQDQLWARVYGAYSPVQALRPVQIRMETEGHKIRSYGWGFIFTGSYFRG